MITGNDVRQLMEKLALDFGGSEFDSSTRVFRNRGGSNIDVRSVPKPEAPRKVNYERNIKPKTDDNEKGFMGGLNSALREAKKELNPNLPRQIYDSRVQNVLQKERMQKLPPAAPAKGGDLGLGKAVHAVGKGAWNAVTNPVGTLQNAAELHDAKMRSDPTKPYYGMSMQDARRKQMEGQINKETGKRIYDSEQIERILKDPMWTHTAEDLARQGAYDPIQEATDTENRFGGQNYPRVERLKKMMELRGRNANIDDKRVMYDDEGNPTGQVAYGYNLPSRNFRSDERNAKLKSFGKNFEYVEDGKDGYYRANPNIIKGMSGGMLTDRAVQKVHDLVAPGGKFTQDQIERMAEDESMGTPVKGFFRRGHRDIMDQPRDVARRKGELAGTVQRYNPVIAPYRAVANIPDAAGWVGDKASNAWDYLWGD